MRGKGSNSEQYSVALLPTKVGHGSKVVRLNLSNDKGLSDYLLGAKIDRTVVLYGHDEVGRLVSVKVAF